MSFEEILVSTNSGITKITLNRPDKRNSLSANLRTELFKVLEKNDQDENINATIIRVLAKLLVRVTI